MRGRKTLVGGKYRLESLLASGGMGEVWIARNQATRAEVAVKLCRRTDAHEETASRFRQEARLGGMLSHRGIVRVFDLVEESDETLVLVMELLRGETLERYLAAHGPLTSVEAIAIALSVLSALAHAHDLAIVHRDVTPANIFLAVDPDGHVTPKLVDFGIAKSKMSGFQTVDGRVLGTPRYMSPEQIRGQGEIDGRSDLFSLAVVVYEMVTGACPFAAISASASLAAVLEAVVDPDPRLDPPVWIELERALSKRPYERHASAREMAHALGLAADEAEDRLAQRFLRAPPSRGPAPRRSEPAQATHGGGAHPVVSAPAKRRARAGWLLAASLLAVCAGAWGVVAVRQSRHPPPPSTAVPVATPVLLPPGPEPPPPVVEPPADVPPAPSVAPTRVPATSSPNRPARLRRARPVATTPGF